MNNKYNCRVKANFRFKALFVLAIIILTLQTELKAQTFPAGFSQVKVATIYYPTSFDFAPDGRIFCSEKSGKVKIIKNGAVLSTPFLQVSVDQLNERGLSCVAIDPNFNSNHYVYVYYTTSGSPIHNRLSRFTANGDVAVPGSEVILKDFEPCVNSIHNGGGMVFGNDGKLYLAVGNDNVNSYSQDLSNYKGKILRMNPDGSIPSGNPYSSPEAAKLIWAYGLRNPWTIAKQPGTGKIFTNEVGEGAWEEINDATIAGRNFGWPAVEGNSSNPAYTNPFYTYPHGPTGTNAGCAITGGAFFNPSSTNYPSQYTGKYFFIDYCNKWINYLDVSTKVKYNFATNLPSALNYVKVGPDGNLYYYSISTNSLYKIIYNNSTAPVITSQPANATVSAGQTASFFVSATGSQPLSYQWQKSGANISGANSATYIINNTQSSNAGSYRVIVTNSYGSATSNYASLTVTAFNAQPTASIQSPSPAFLYHGGDIISFLGSGTDPEDGTLPASAFQWVIEFHHDSHVHPGPTIPPGVKSGTFAISKTGEVSPNVFFRLILTVTDSQGGQNTVYRDIYPKKSQITLASQPSGLQVLLDDLPHLTTYTLMAVAGMERKLGAAAQQTINNTVYAFTNWLHGGNQTQTITVGDNNQTYTAVFAATGTTSPSSGTCSASGTILREFWANVSGWSVSNIPVYSVPTSTSYLTSFKEPSNVGDNYGSRVRGYVCPPATGNYTFWIASDDNSELWLSTTDQPSNKVKIAYVNGYTQSMEWTKYASQKSVAMNLTAGKKYYIEALHKEGSQGDNMAVGWQLPNGTLERPIPGSRLATYGSTPISPISVSITSPGNGTSFSSPANITFKASATSGNGAIAKVEYFSGANKVGEATTSPYSFTWWNVTTGNYYIHAVATDVSAQSKSSQTISVNVTSCPTPTITPSGPTTICSGLVTLNCNTASGNSYQWKKDGVNIDGATASSYNAGSTGDYQVKVTNGSCIGWSAPMRVTISTNLTAKITSGGPLEFCTGGSVKLYANTCSGYTYQWKKNGSDIVGATGPTYIATTTGSYQVKIIQGSSVAWSALVTTTVNSCGGKNALASDSLNNVGLNDSFHLSVYPNPTSGVFSFDVCIEDTEQSIMEMKVLSATGQLVYSRPEAYVSGCIKETIDLPGELPTGIYILQLRIGNKMETTKVILSNGK